MKRIILQNSQSPGDILMLTAAVRDLHRCHPGRFQTDVRTSCGALWENNPHVTPLREKGRGVEVIPCHYPLVHRSNTAGVHFLLGFMEHLNSVLGTKIQPTVFGGDVHLSRKEKRRASMVAERVGREIPYWLIVAGGKYDYTIKWWHFRRYQAVVDHFRGRIQFVQVGDPGHYHPRLQGVIDLVGATSLRELIRLVYRAQGVLCPVTFLMHLAAAVEMPPGTGPSRACVVVAGGREPPHWEAYPHHQFIHTVGALACCAQGGCWRARTVALGDGDEKDEPGKLCVDVRGGLPRCMDLISPEEVIRRVGGYFESGSLHYLTRAEARTAAPHLRVSHRDLLLGRRGTR